MASRRLLLAAGAAGAGLAAAGFGEAAGRVAGREAAAPRTLAPEAWVDPATGAVTPNPQQFIAHVACPGCDVPCGARLRVDRASGRVLRITGNPYHPRSADPPLPAAATLREAIAAMSGWQERGLAQRATVCARGAVLPPAQDDPARLLSPLKRIGARGGGQWQTVPLEQVVREVVEGGDLFGEGKVEGLRALRHDGAARPVLLVAGRENGRIAFVHSFVRAYGSAALGVQQAALPRPDLRDAAFVVVFGGTLPGSLLGRQIAERRAAGKLVTVLADAVLGPGDNIAVGAQSRWLPIRPGSEGALARAMVRHVTGQAGPEAAEDAAAICGVPEADIAALAREFAAHGRRAASVAAGPAGAGAAVALNALAGHAAPPALAERTADGVKALFLWDCDPAPHVGAPLVVAVGATLAESMRQADYVVPDTLAFENWGWFAAPGAGVTTSWPATAPPPVGMERLLIACGRALDLPGFGPGTPDDAAFWHIHAIAALAAAQPAMPPISDDDLVLSGLDRIRPLLEAALDEPAWRRAAFLLARGGRFDLADAAAPADGFDARLPALPFFQSATTGSAEWPLLLAVRAPLRPGATTVALHVADAAARGLRTGDAVMVETPAGHCAGRLLVRAGLMRGVVAVSGTMQDGLPARLTRT